MSLLATIASDVQHDFDLVALAAVQQFEGGAVASYKSTMVYVVPPSADPRAHRALAKLRTVIEIVPQSDDYVLFRGYVRVTKFTVDGDTATFSGTRGPVPRHATLNCGTSEDMQFVRVNSEWKLSGGTTTVC